jgi:hypothetical protein
LTYQQATSSRWVGGSRGPAVTFNGTNNRIEPVTSLDAPQIKNNLGFRWTMMSWFRCDEITATGRIIVSYRSTVAALPILFQLDVAKTTGLVRMFVEDDAGNLALASSATAITLDKWHHAAAVRDGDNVTAYLDGNPGTTVSAAFTNSYNINAFIIGAGVAGSGVRSGLFSGEIDRILLVKRPLSRQEILKEMISPESLFVKSRAPFIGGVAAAATTVVTPGGFPHIAGYIGEYPGYGDI